VTGDLLRTSPVICMGSRSVLQKHDRDLEIKITLSVIQTEM
jgi:hypothetical protein